MCPSIESAAGSVQVDQEEKKQISWIESVVVMGVFFSSLLLGSDFFFPFPIKHMQTSFLFKVGGEVRDPDIQPTARYYLKSLFWDEMLAW